MTIGSLFSGIGGFDLAFERVGAVSAWQVEIDKRCRVMPGLRRLTPMECERLQGFPDGWTAGE